MFISVSEISQIEAENELRLRGLRSFVDKIKGLGLGARITDDLMADALKDTQLLWVLWPNRWFMPPELEAIRKRIENGMGLLVTSEWSGIEYNAEILNSLVEDMGLKFNKDRIIDPINAYTEDEMQGKGSGGVMSAGKIVEFIKIKDFSKHITTQELDELAYYSGCSLTVAPEKYIAKSKFVSFSDVDGNKKWTEGERIGAAVTAAFSELGAGRIMAVGDTSLFTDKYIKFGDNEKFMVNTLKWLLKKI